jgi:choline kinase
MKHAVVIAAGMGSRLAPFLPVPKPLAPVGGRPLLFWALEGAERAGCREAVVVVGYRAEEIQQWVQSAYTGRLRLRFVYNPDFHKQNGISVLAARPYVEGSFLLLMADHIVEAAALERFRQRQGLNRGALLVVDSRIESIADLEDATKVLVQEGKVVEIGKELVHYTAVDTGIFWATRDLLDAIAAVVQLRGDASLTDGVRQLAHQGLMWAEELGDYFWQDVDTPQTYAVAQEWARRALAAG